MDSSLIFIFSALAIFIAYFVVFCIRNKIDPRKYFKTSSGKGIRNGILAVFSIALVITAIGFLGGCSSGTYVKDAKMFAGIDYTKGRSPMCHDGPDDRSTSNVGFKLTAWESDDERTKITANYTHHSCAFNKDNHKYDGFGAGVEYIFWQRRE